jgi:hypothetical protein
MAAFSFPAPDGVRVQIDRPVNRDGTNRGTVEGLRSAGATYVVER